MFDKFGVFFLFQKIIFVLCNFCLSQDENIIKFTKKETTAKPAAKPKRVVKERPTMPKKKVSKFDKVSSKYIATHTIESGESLSYIAKKYYDSGSRENWMKIYEENKELIGDDPNMIQPGQVLRIPRI